MHLSWCALVETSAKEQLQGAPSTGFALQDLAAAAGGATAPTHIAGDVLLWELARKRPERVQYMTACEGASSLFRQQYGQARCMRKQHACAPAGAVGQV